MTHGGKRKGAGRPPGTAKKDSKVQMHIRIHPDLAAWLRRQPEGISPKIERLIKDDMIII